MRQAIVTEPGPPSSIRIVEAADPHPRPGEVLVRVAAAAVNRIDISTRNGNLLHAGLLTPADHYHLGWDVAGEVTEVGDGVRRFSVGDAVIGLRDVLSDPGTSADLVVLRESALAPAPRGVAAEVAAGLPLAGLTALRSLELSGARPGDWLLVTGASGGVGRLVVQLAHHRGVRVLAAGNDRDRDDLESCGAEVVLGRDADLPREVRAVTGEGAHAVIDGAVRGTAAHEALRSRGAFIALVAPFAPPPLRGTTVTTQEVFADGSALGVLSAMLETGAITARVAETFPLEQIAAAHEAVEAGGRQGRVVLVP